MDVLDKSQDGDTQRSLQVRGMDLKYSLFQHVTMALNM
jgi:hypothetical protein